MNHTQSAETLFWNNVLKVSEAALSADHSAESVCGLLLALEEGFAYSFDPADRFQEYVTLTLCRSVRHLLESGGAPGRSR